MKKLIFLLLLLCQLAQAEEIKMYVLEQHFDGYTTITICSEKDILNDFKKLTLTKEEKEKIKNWKKWKRSKTTIASWILEDRFDYIIRQEFIDTKKRFSVCIYDNSYNDKQI